MKRAEIQGIRDLAVECAMDSDSAVIANAYIRVAEALDALDAVIARHLHEGTTEFIPDLDDLEAEGEEGDEGEESELEAEEEEEEEEEEPEPPPPAKKAQAGSQRGKQPANGKRLGAIPKPPADDGPLF